MRNRTCRTSGSLKACTDLSASSPLRIYVLLKAPHKSPYRRTPMLWHRGKEKIKMLKEMLTQLDPTMSNTESVLWLGIQVCPCAQNTSVIWRHQEQQTTGGRNPPSFRTYLHPFSIDFHEQDTEGVGFGSDIPVQKVLAADGQLDLADAVLGADRPHWRGSPGVRHGLQQQQPQAVCGTREKGERPQGKQ